MSTPPAFSGPLPGNPPVPVTRLRQVVDGMHEGVVVRDASGTIVDLNPAAERILRRPRAELIGSKTVNPRTAVNPDGSPFPHHESAASVALATGRDVVEQLNGVTHGRRRAALDLGQRARPARRRRHHGRRHDVHRRHRAAQDGRRAGRVGAALPVAGRERRRPHHEHRCARHSHLRVALVPDPPRLRAGRADRPDGRRHRPPRRPRRTSSATCSPCTTRGRRAARGASCTRTVTGSGWRRAAAPCSTSRAESSSCRPPPATSPSAVRRRRRCAPARPLPSPHATRSRPCWTRRRSTRSSAPTPTA